MSTNTLDGLLENWAEEEVELEEEQVGFANSSDRIEGHQVAEVKVTMVKLVPTKGKTVWVEFDFESKDGKTLRERQVLVGSKGASTYVRGGKKVNQTGVSKLMSLAIISGKFENSKTLLKDIKATTEKMEVKFSEYGKDIVADYIVFPTLIGSKVKIAVSSTKVNGRGQLGDAYVDACHKATKAFSKANPKKRFAEKVAKCSGDDYVDVYKNFVESEVKHFITPSGQLRSEMGTDSTELMQKFIDSKDEGYVYDKRTLFVEKLSEAELKKLSIDKYGKFVEPEDDDGVEPEPEVEASEDVETEDDEW